MASLKNTIRGFHHDEDGLEALQIVMILAIAVMILVAASTVGSQAVKWMGDKWKALQGQNITLGG